MANPHCDTKHQAARRAGACENGGCACDGKERCSTAEEFYARELPPAVIEYFKKEHPPREVMDFIVDNVNELLTEEARQAQFVSDVSHEIRTPLTAIRGTAETLLDGGVPEELQRRFLAQIINECDRLTRLANDLLTLQNFSNPVAGINNYWCSGGELRNTGYEVSLSVKPVVTKDWRVEMGASVGHYKNEVTKLPAGNFETEVYGASILTAVNNPVGLFYGYKTEGVFADDAAAQTAAVNANPATRDTYLYFEDQAGARQYFKAGDVHFSDLDNNGVIDERDRTVIGDPNPDIYGNIFANVNWKNLTLSLGFNYSLGNDVYNYQRSILNSGATLYNQQVAETSHWRYEGQQTSLPRVAYGDPMGNNRFSDRWIEDGSYLRLKTVNLSYRVPVPGSWTWLQGLTVWAEAQNLLTLTKYTGNDPEFSIGNSVYYQGIDCGTLAQGRSFTFGVKINL